jgi:nicotinamidase/pyrazinamidase
MNMIKINRDKDALIIVDVQNDFCPGGALPVFRGDEVVPIINALFPSFDMIFTTQDWHPANHISFIEQGGLWPPHCIAGTKGAELHPHLRITGAAYIKKGTDPDKEAYSGFQDTDLAERLRDSGAKRLFIVGLATDYCVKATVLDAITSGFRVIVVADAVRGVEVHPGDSASAIDEMRRAGAAISRLDEIVEVAPRLLVF